MVAELKISSPGETDRKRRLRDVTIESEVQAEALIALDARVTAIEALLAVVGLADTGPPIVTADSRFVEITEAESRIVAGRVKTAIVDGRTNLTTVSRIVQS